MFFMRALLVVRSRLICHIFLEETKRCVQSAAFVACMRVRKKALRMRNQTNQIRGGYDYILLQLCHFANAGLQNGTNQMDRRNPILE